MKASVVTAPGRIEVDEFELPRPGPGEVLVRIERAAICGSDIHSVDEEHWAEAYPTEAGWPGHEAVEPSWMGGRMRPNPAIASCWCRS